MSAMSEQTPSPLVSADDWAAAPTAMRALVQTQQQQIAQQAVRITAVWHRRSDDLTATCTTALRGDDPPSLLLLSPAHPSAVSRLQPAA